MKLKYLITMAVLMLCALFSCYEKKLTKSEHVSSGTWNESRTQFIFLRWERDFYRPEGITKFPDGGIPKYIRDEKFICVYSKNTGTVTAVAKARGKPRGYPPSVRFSWKAGKAAYKIWNADKKENALNPVVVIDMKTMEEQDFFSIGERPELSPDGKRIATVKDNCVRIMNCDGTEGKIVFESGEPRLIFLMWNTPGEIDLYLNDQGKFIVYTLDLQKSELKKTGKPYLKNFGNEWTQRVLDKKK